MADTFDLVLYQTNTPSGAQIRLKTDSDYDHVGIVLRFGKKPEEVYLMEAGEHGCEVRFKRMAHVLAVVGEGERDYYS